MTTYTFHAVKRDGTIVRKEGLSLSEATSEMDDLTCVEDFSVAQLEAESHPFVENPANEPERGPSGEDHLLEGLADHPDEA